MPELTLPGRLEMLDKVKKRYKIVIGGRGSAKSQTVADLCIRDSQTKRLKIGCFREFQNSIEDSVHSLLKDEIRRMEVGGFTVNATSIHNRWGGAFKFRGLARNPDAMKSMHGFTRFWVEEAQTISEESLRLLTPTLREDDSEIWMTANPQSSADPFSQRFLVPFQRDLDRDGYYEDEMHLIIVSNYMHNPFFPAVLEAERAFDEAHLSRAEYEHIWLGKFNDTVEGAIIPVEWFNAAIDAHVVLGIRPGGVIIVTHDPSDLGPDPKGLVRRHGSIVLDVQEKTTGTAEEGMDWACEYAIEHHADVFRWDCDGLGVSLKRQAATALDGKRMDISMFKGSEGVDNPNAIYQPDQQIDKSNAKTNAQTFKNKRAQYYWALRDRFQATYMATQKGLYRDPDTLISLSSDIEIIDRLRSEVCRIPRKYNANGYIQIMSKEEMKKPPLRIPSPNLADALMMSMPGHTRNLAYSHKARPVQRRSVAGWT